MRLADRDRALLDGAQGDAVRKAMEALAELGEAFDAPDMVDIGYAHVHAGMAMYAGDVELMEELAASGARMQAPTSANIANADMTGANATNAPEALVSLQQRAEAAHAAMGSSRCFTCAPYWAGHWPTWNMHMASIESGVTVFSNSVLGARCNRDGFFAVYAGMTARYPRFGLHLDENRRPTHRVFVEATPNGTSDFSVLGYVIGAALTNGAPLVSGLKRRPTLDELDALGAGMATSGGIAMFIIGGVTPPYASESDAISGQLPTLCVTDADLQAVYQDFCTGSVDDFDIVHLGCPHASFEEMKHYAALFSDATVKPGVEVWITTSRTVVQMARESGLVEPIERAGVKLVADTCPITCHFARTCSPDEKLGLAPPTLKTIIVDSAKQAHYVRNMVQCPTLLTTTENAAASAVAGRFIPCA